MAKKELTATFAFKRSTKGTHVYEEVDAKGEPARNVVGSLYIQRAALPGEPPAKIIATFKVE
jgi:hypothetical protein